MLTNKALEPTIVVFADIVDQDQTAWNVKTHLGSTLCAPVLHIPSKSDRWYLGYFNPLPHSRLLTTLGK